MSNAIYIVDLAANGIAEPADSLPALWNQVFPLLSEGTKPSPKYVELARNVEERMRLGGGKPLTLGAVQKRLDYPSEEAQSLTTAAWPYGLPDGDGRFSSMQVLHAIVLEAMELDLLVLADAFGVAFLPGREVISESAPESDWAILLEEAPDYEGQSQPAMTRAQMVKRILGMMAEALSPHGFALSKFKPLDHKGRPKKEVFYFVRHGPEGIQHISLVAGKSAGDLRLFFEAGGYNHHVDAALAIVRAGTLADNQPLESICDYEVPYRFTRHYESVLDEKTRDMSWPARWRNPVDVLIVVSEEGIFLAAAVEDLVQAICHACVPILDQLCSVEGIARAFLDGRGQLVDEAVAMTETNQHAALVAGHLLGTSSLDGFVASVERYCARSAWTNYDGIERRIQNLKNLLVELERKVPRLPAR